MKKLSKLVSLMLSAVLCIGMASPAFAGIYYLEEGSVTVSNKDGTTWVDQGETSKEDNDITITQKDSGKTTSNTIAVGENVTDTTITLKDVNIGVPDISKAALSITGTGEENDETHVTINLEGKNTLKSGYGHAGLELNKGASVTIQAEEPSEEGKPNSLEATGGIGGAGIGSGYKGTAGDITIAGYAEVNATGGDSGAGIGSGGEGTVDDITITENAKIVKAMGGGLGTGIGAGSSSTVGDIKISGSADVTAISDFTGIGSAASGTAGNINISDNAVVNASGGRGTGIGGSAGEINISGSAKVVATSSDDTGIGAGVCDEVGEINISGSADVIAEGYYTGIGAATSGKVGKINISGSAKVEATSSKDTGIGAGRSGEVGDINISGSAKVEVISCGDVGIGAGRSGTAGNINISGTGTVTVTGNWGDADIGGGVSSTTGDITFPCSVKNESGEVARAGADVFGQTGTIRVIHTPGDPVRENETASPYEEVVYCSVCHKELSRVTHTISNSGAGDTGDTGGTGGFTPATLEAATLEDQAVPLAGLIPLHEILEALRLHEEIEEIELPEDFKWIDHEHAQAIYWALQEELVMDTEEEPLDPDETLTVGLMRKVLVNFVELYLGLDDFVVTLAGEDDEIVFDLGERLTAFYGDLEAYLKAQKTKAA